MKKLALKDVKLKIYAPPERKVSYWASAHCWLIRSARKMDSSLGGADGTVLDMDRRQYPGRPEHVQEGELSDPCWLWPSMSRRNAHMRRCGFPQTSTRRIRISSIRRPSDVSSCAPRQPVCQARLVRRLVYNERTTSLPWWAIVHLHAGHAITDRQALGMSGWSASLRSLMPS